MSDFFHRCDRECLHHIEAHMETNGCFKSDDDCIDIRKDIKGAEEYLSLRRQKHESTD